MHKVLSIFGLVVLVGALAAARHGQILNRSGNGELSDADGDTGWECGTTDDTCYYKTNKGTDITLTDNSAAFVGAVSVGTTLAVTTGLTSPIVGSSTFDIRFCGNGPDGGTETFVSPVLLSADESGYVFGGAGCDGEDNTTIATADEVYHAGFALKPVAMSCVGLCTGATAANDAIVFKLYDDTSAVTGMTCTTAALGGDATPAQCSVRTASPQTIAAGSAIAIGIDNTDDDCNDAGDDFECIVTVTF